MIQVNENYGEVAGSYLFSEIAKRTAAFQESHPDVKVMKLGIGNTTEPLCPTIIAGLHKGVEKLSKVETYSGYGAEQGDPRLRKAIAGVYQERGVNLDSGEIFVSDGAKCDSANIQSIFGLENIVAVQDPAYPVYVDTNLLSGREVTYLPCLAENDFFPQVPNGRRADLIYLCFPNNPTGAVATKEQLKEFVDFAREEGSIILYDTAYSAFISDDDIPRSIYEVGGAKECAIEIGSFSKSAGFTGVRLGWTVVPFDLKGGQFPLEGGQVNGMWNRRQTTFFNGASNIVQEGGLAALTPEGRTECQETIDYYMQNARIIREGLVEKGLNVHGGVHAPYLWAEIPSGLTSWGFFDKVLEEAHVVGAPGSGFGNNGEGYFRFSSFGHRENIIEAVESIKANLKL